MPITVSHTVIHGNGERGRGMPGFPGSKFPRLRLISPRPGRRSGLRSWAWPPWGKRMAIQGMPAGNARAERGRAQKRGTFNREIARRLGLWEGAVRKRLRRTGWTDPAPEQKPLPLGERRLRRRIPPRLWPKRDAYQTCPLFASRTMRRSPSITIQPTAGSIG